jgi:hypothetical protein
LDEILGAASSAVLNARKLKFWLQTSFEPTWCRGEWGCVKHGANETRTLFFVETYFKLVFSEK